MRIKDLFRHFSRHKHAGQGPQAEATSEKANIIDMTVRDRDGGTVAEPIGSGSNRTERRERPRWQLWLGLVLILALVGALWLLPGTLTSRSADQFVVLVASFTNANDDQTGRSVANDLVDVLEHEQADAFVVKRLDEVLVDEQAALDAASQHAADVVIWGRVTLGGLLDDTTLLPRLTYTPRGSYAPNAWAGYTGRFSMPQNYNLAAEPINGKAVLPRLLQSLADYHRGAADAAYEELGQLLEEEDYPLNVPLLRAVRGNVLWARGAYAQAADEYRRALEQPTGVSEYEQARLANNLGAILLAKENNDDAVRALATSIHFLGRQDLGELRFNLGLLALQQNRAAEAVTELEQAQNLIDPNAPLWLALAQAYREAGQMEQAESALVAAEQQIRHDANNVPPDLRDLVTQRLRAATLEQRGLLRLAQLVHAQGPLLWELEIAPQQPANALDSARDALNSAVTISSELITNWQRRSPASEVAQAGNWPVVDGQAQRAREAYDRQQYHLALVLIEEGRTNTPGSTGLFASLAEGLFGNRTPLDEAIARLQTLLNAEPNEGPITLTRPEDLPRRIAYARALRHKHAFDAATQNYDQIINQYPQHPEGYFGKGAVALEIGNRDEARQLMTQAVERDTNFFPAYIKLAEMAEQERDWAAAVEHLRALANQRPSADRSIKLASVLRQSGPEGYIEAERALVDLINAEDGTVSAPDKSAALIELGRLYRDAGRIDAAIQAFEEAKRSDVHRSAAAFELGQTLSNQREDDVNAAAQFRDAIAYDGNNALAHLALADLYAGSLNQPNDADTHYRRAVEAGIRDVDRLLQIGNVLLDHNRAETAAEAFQRAVNEQPNNPLPHHGLGQAYLMLENPEGAGAEEQRALELLDASGVVNPEVRAEILVGLGDVARQRQQYDQALGLYNQALDLNPVQIDAKIGLGQVSASQGNWAVALGHFSTAASFPDAERDPAVHFWVAEALLRQPDLEAASAAYNRALALDPVFPQAWLGLAHAQLALEERSTASDSISEALRLRPQYAEAHLFRGKMLQEEGRIDAALDAYNAAIRANDRIAESRYYRGLVYIEKLDYNQAVRDLEKAVALQPNFPDAHYWLGRTYFAQGRMPRAVDQFKTAIDQRGGTYIEARLYQGMAEEELNRRAEAAESFQAVVQADGDGPLGTMARAELARMER